MVNLIKFLLSSPHKWRTWRDRRYHKLFPDLLIHCLNLDKCRSRTDFTCCQLNALRHKIRKRDWRRYRKRTCLSPVPPGKRRDSSSIRQRLLPSASFPIHRSYHSSVQQCTRKRERTRSTGLWQWERGYAPHEHHGRGVEKGVCAMKRNRWITVDPNGE